MQMNRIGAFGVFNPHTHTAKYVVKWTDWQDETAMEREQPCADWEAALAVQVTAMARPGVVEVTIIKVSRE
jgi:hypothetical protein